MIGMVADIAYRCVTLNPHLNQKALEKTNGLVLIDEIDLHLHPKWQKRVVNDLKKTFPQIQFIATTHSPFIVQSLQSDEVINLDKATDSDFFVPSLQDAERPVQAFPRRAWEREQFGYRSQLAGRGASCAGIPTLSVGTRTTTTSMFREWSGADFPKPRHRGFGLDHSHSEI
jgi:hypothetical protein